MANEIIINEQPLEKRIAILEDNRLVELLVEKNEVKNVVGNIYKGIVKDVLPGMGAAFIDIGLDRTAFLHYSDIFTDYLDNIDSKSHTLSQIDKDSSKIGNFINPGQEIIVQVQKGPIGKKGARLTGQISIPGKFLVYIPSKSNISLSRKITDNDEKKRIKSILSSVKEPNVGMIVRTAAAGNSEEEFLSEYKILKNTWRFVEKQIKYSKAPVCIYDENNLFNTLIRDLFSTKFDYLVVDSKPLRNEIISKLRIMSPELCHRVELYTEDSPIFDAFGIEKEIENIFKSRINLPSGGNIVIELTEALVAMDINTGSFTGKKNYEETVKLTNIEAAKEIARQIRLRDLSGIIVVDFIDMKDEESRQEVLSALRKSLKKDRGKNKIYPFGNLGLVEITRKRMRTNILYTYSEQCPHCNGSGRVLSRDSVAMKIYRWLQRAEYFIKDSSLKLFVHPNVKTFLDENPSYLKVVSNTIIIHSDKSLNQDSFKIFDGDSGKEITNKYNS